jgi:AcrR family transcriptional regulator
MTATSRRHTLRADKRRVVAEAIWHAALDLYAARGYGETTVEAIAEAAGVSRRTFFRYFSSKEDIALYAMDAYGDLLVQAIQDSPPAGRPIEIVRAAVLRVAAFVVAQPTARRSMQIIDENPAVKAAQLSRLHRIEHNVAAAFSSALRLHHPQDPRAAVLASTTLALLDLTCRTWYRKSPARVEPTVDRLIDAVGILAPASPRIRPRARR